MSKLSNQLIQNRLLAEAKSEEVKATYSTMTPPSGKAQKIGTPKDPSGRSTKITQVTVPTNHKAGGKKSSSATPNMGIPAADYANKTIDSNKVPSWSNSKAESSPKTPSVQRMVPNQETKLKAVTGEIKNTEGGKTSGANTIPAAEDAGDTVRKMPHGNSTMKSSGNGVPTVTAPTPKKMNSTTRPKSKAAKLKTTEPGSQKVAQVSHAGKMSKDPSDAMSRTVSVVQGHKGHNVMESVQLHLGGKPKASFDIADRRVVKKIIESYKAHGYDLKVVRGHVPAWRKDRSILKNIWESIDASYNGSPMTSQSLRKKAQSAFFKANQSSYTHMYESKKDFVSTLSAAFDRVMEKADLEYRESLAPFDGQARVMLGEDIMDIAMVTQATDMDMALRNFRNELIEEYGFKLKVSHIFVDGEKKTLKDITEWAEGAKKQFKLAENEHNEYGPNRPFLVRNSVRSGPGISFVSKEEAFDYLRKRNPAEAGQLEVLQWDDEKQYYGPNTMTEADPTTSGMDAGKTQEVYQWLTQLDDQKKRHFVVNFRNPHSLFNITSKFWPGGSASLQKVNWHAIAKAGLGKWENGNPIALGRFGAGSGTLEV